MTILFIVAAALFGAYEIYYGFWAYRKNGFPFYWAAGLLIGVPFLMVSALTAVSGSFRNTWLEASVLVIWVFGELWKAWKKHQARQKYPEQWAKWEKILKSSSKPPVRQETRP